MADQPNLYLRAMASAQKVGNRFDGNLLTNDPAGD
ncbi:MAG: hypothetical protein C1O27_002521 [Chloroflexi bacterium]|jgi:hypothetical protein|nr:MAG: hypothetical protein C1O27_002521 [Chloroflexota bacterium]